MIQFNKVTKSFGAQRLFEDLSFSINRRERVGLVGRNGHGKTTVFRMVLGDVSPDAGEIVIPKRYRIGHLDQPADVSRARVLFDIARGASADRREIGLGKAVWCDDGFLFAQEPIRRLERTYQPLR